MKNVIFRCTHRLLVIFLLGALASSAAVSTPARAIDAVVVRINPSESLGPLPRLFRPSAMLAFADVEALNAFLDLPGPIGAVRLTLETFLTESTSLDDYRNRLAVSAKHDMRPGGIARRLLERRAEVVLTFARMPAWLARSKDSRLAGPSGFTIREASPPRDYRVFEELVYQTVRILNRDHGLSPVYELWNEPNSQIFWRGTRADLFRTYAAFVAGARRADPTARVGGLGVSPWDARKEGESAKTGPLLREFVNYAAAPPSGIGSSGRLPIDFISWHYYDSSPEAGWSSGIEHIKRWLRSAGFSADLPQAITEWNYWSTFPEWLDPSRDDTVGAAYIPAALHAMDRAGVAMQTFSSLQDFRWPSSDTAFIGCFGLVTRPPVMKKASFNVMHMLGLLEDHRLSVNVPIEIIDAQGVGALATAGADRIAILLHRFANDPRGTVIRSLTRFGLERLEAAGISERQFASFLRHELELSQRQIPPDIRRALEQARAQADKARHASAEEVTLTLQILTWPESVRYQIFLVDAQHANPAATYRRLRRAGRSHEQALIAARRDGTLVPWAQGTGKLPPLKLGSYAVALVIAERPQ